MKKVLLVLALIATSAHAEIENPFQLFSTGNNMTNETQVKWVQVDDINKTCEAESRKRGHGGFGYGVDACTFWTKETFSKWTCTVYTKKKVDTATFGHEMRHCFQGGFHK